MRGASYFVLTVVFYIRFSFVSSIETSESMVYGHSCHSTHTGGTFGIRRLSWLVTKQSVFLAQCYPAFLLFFNFMLMLSLALVTLHRYHKQIKYLGKILVPPFWASLSKYLLYTLQMSSKYSRTRPFCTSTSGDAASTCNS